MIVIRKINPASASSKCTISQGLKRIAQIITINMAMM